MKFNKIFLPVVAMASLLAASCTDDVKYTPAEPSPLAQYYFTTTNSDTQELLDGSTSFNVTIARANSEGEATVDIQSTVDPAGAFTIPQSVTFADGEGVKNLKVAYDLNSIEVNTHYTITLTIPGIENTPYSYGTLAIDVIYLPWPTMVGENGEDFGWYRDGYFYGLFTGLECFEYQVTIQQHPTTEGIYRIVNPYGPAANPFWEEFFGGYDTENDYYMVINAQDPDKVYVETSKTGLLMDGDPSSPVYVSSMVANSLAGGAAPDPAMYGTLKDGVITMPERSLLSLMDLGDGLSGYYGNIQSSFRVVLPGYEKPTEWVVLGACEFTDGFYGKYLLGDDYVPQPYKVIVEQHMQEQGQYRIVNPYSVYGADAEGGADYFDIDASDPACVFWKYDTGKTIGMTPVFCGTYANYMYENNKADYDEVASSGVGGILQNNVFTVPGEYAGVYTVSRRATWNPSNIEAKLDISNPEAVEEDEAAAKHFNGKRELSKRAVKANVQLAR